MVEKEDLHVFDFPRCCYLMRHCVEMLDRLFEDASTNFQKLVFNFSKMELASSLSILTSILGKISKMALFYAFWRLATLISLDQNHIFEICKSILL